MQSPYGPALPGYRMVDLNDLLGVPDFLKFPLAENPSKQPPIISERIRVNQVSALKGQSFEDHAIGSILRGAGVRRREKICSVLHNAGNGNHIAGIPSCLILLLRVLTSRLKTSWVKITTSKRESYCWAS